MGSGRTRLGDEGMAPRSPTRAQLWAPLTPEHDPFPYYTQILGPGLCLYGITKENMLAQK